LSSQSLRRIWRAFPLPLPLREWVDRIYLYPKIPGLGRHPVNRGGPLTILGYLNSGLGIGEAARQQVLALQRAGVPHAWADVSYVQGIRDLEDPRFAEPPDFPRAGPILVHANASETGRVLKSIPSDLLVGRPLIGFWAWELDRPPLVWWRAFQYLHELWVPSDFVAEVFRPHSPVPVRVVPTPVQPPPTEGLTRADFGLSEGSCIYLCMADGRSDLVRKNIAGAVRAFRLAHDGDPAATLVVKLHNVETSSEGFRHLQAVIQGASNIAVITRFLPSTAVGDLFRAADVFLSLHRSEGFSLPLAQAMLLGRPVIATAYSGNMTFMNHQVARLINFTLVPVRSERRVYAEVPGARWAETSVDQAAQAMVALTASPALRKEIGEAGRAFAARALAPKRFLEALAPWTGVSAE